MARRGRRGAADLPAAVVDTHALLFHAAGGRGLGSKAAAFFERCEIQQAILYVPAIVMWECSLLARLSRINMRRTVQGFFEDLFSNPAYQPLGLSPEQVYLADELRFSRDPFDILICAAARTLDLPLITRDADIRGAGVVKIIW
jgi:PIN domain nuclease of toxin-antitoxin system